LVGKTDEEESAHERLKITRSFASGSERVGTKKEVVVTTRGRGLNLLPQTIGAVFANE
jgi:hypothetical protein